MKTNSIGSVRAIVGIMMGVALSIGVLALTAFWQPPEEKKPPEQVPPSVPPEISGGQNLTLESDPTEGETATGPGTGTEPLPADLEPAIPEEDNPPTSGEKPPEPAPVKDSSSEKPAGNTVEKAGSSLQAPTKENIPQLNEPVKSDKPQEGASAESVQDDVKEEKIGTVPEGASPQ